MEKIKRNDDGFFQIQNEFNKLVENIARESDNKKFIGGLPITLEQKDLFSILSKDSGGNYRYSITQKVDGTRFLLFANYKKDSGLRNITFIDRNSDFYTFKNVEREELPGFLGPKILLDGEIL